MFGPMNRLDVREDGDPGGVDRGRPEDQRCRRTSAVTTCWIANWTRPVISAKAGGVASTVAVKVTDWPRVVSTGEETTVVVVRVLSTIRFVVAVLVAKPAGPE